jgi:transcriptional regulator with XRE-family HTH domain/tetratricopeptide (TPR) repeat protein
MMIGVAINGAVLRRFRRDRGWSQDRLANEGQAFAQRVGESSGLNGATICRLEKEEHPPSKATLRHVVGALELTRDELVELLRGDEPPPRWLLELAREAQPQADPPPTEEKPPMDRRQFTIALPTVMVSHVARPSATDPLRAETDALTGDYATTSPQKLLPRLRRHLDALLRELRTKSMSDGVRRRLLVDVSEIAAEAGLMALFANHPGESDAYFTQALRYANESGVERARGGVLLAASTFHNVSVGNGDSATALGMLQAAEPLISGLCAKNVVLLQAQELATLKREHEHEAMEALERAQSIDATDDGEGLYSRHGYLAGWQTRDPRIRGRALARLGRTDDALAMLHEALAVPTPNTRDTACTLGDIALAYMIGKQLEPACAAAMRSLDHSGAVGYQIAADRIRGVRDMMPRKWSTAAPVRALDERLRRA